METTENIEFKRSPKRKRYIRRSLLGSRSTAKKKRRRIIYAVGGTAAASAIAGGLYYAKRKRNAIKSKSTPLLTGYGKSGTSGRRRKKYRQYLPGDRTNNPSSNITKSSNGKRKRGTFQPKRRFKGSPRSSSRDRNFLRDRLSEKQIHRLSNNYGYDFKTNSFNPNISASARRKGERLIGSVSAPRRKRRKSSK